MLVRPMSKSLYNFMMEIDKGSFDRQENSLGCGK